MKTFLIFLAIGLVTGEKLGFGYLPPPGAYLSGGNPGDIQGPLEPPRTTGTFNSRPLLDGQYPNNFVIQGSPQPGTVDSFVTEKVPSTTTTYAFSQTTTYPESYETTVLPIDPVTGLPIKRLNQNYAQPGYVQNNKQNGPYGDNVAQDQYGNKIITIGTKPNIGSNVNQPLNQNDNFPSLRNPNSQYQYGDKIPQNIQPGSQQGFSTSAPTTAAIIPVNLYNTNEGYPGTNPQGTYSGAPIQVQENTQFIQPSYQGNVYEDGKSPINVNTARPFIGTNENVYKPGVSVSNGLPSSTAASIPSSSYSPIYSTIRPFNRPKRPQAETDRNAVILNFENIRTPNGYSYSYDTSNGIHADETGVVDNGTKAQGKYSYIGDDGKIYSVSYTADENGFRPYGDHLPTPPPVPEAIQKVIEQAARDKAAGIVDDGSYDEAKYGDNTYRTPTNRRRPQYNNKVQQNQLENDRNTAGGRPIFSTTEPIVGTIMDQENSNERDNNNIYTTKQPFGANVISNAPGVVIEETRGQQLNPKAPFNLNEIVGTTIGPNNAVNYPSYDNQNIIVDKTRPGAFNIVSNNLQNLGKPVDINNNQYSSTQAPEYNQYTKQYNGLPKIEQSFSPKLNNVNGGQSQLQQQTFGNNPINQKDETGYYYQTPNTKFTEFRPQQHLNGQIIGPVTTVDNRGKPIRRPFITPDAKFSFKNTNQDGNANKGEATPSNIERISSSMPPQVLITSKGTNIPYGQKLNKVTVAPGSKDNLGSTIFESTSPLPEGSRLQDTGVRKPEQNEQPQFTTVTTRRPILEYDSQTPKYSTGYPSESYRVSGSPGYNPSFTTPGYTYTDKVSQTPGYTTTAVPSTTRYYQPFQGNSPSSINDQRYYLPGSYYPSQSSTVGPTSNSIVNGIPTSTAAPVFGPNYQFGQSNGPIRGSIVTSQVPTSTTTPVLGPGYQYEPGKYINNEYTYPGSTTSISQPTTPGSTENRPYGPGQSSKVASPLFNNGVGSPYTIGMEYGNGPVQQVYLSTTPSYVGTSSVSPVKTINQGYYQPSSKSTLVDEFGRQIISGFPNGNIPTNGSGNRFGTTVSPVSTNLVDEFGRPVDEFGRPVTSIQSNGNIPANRTPAVPSSNTNVVDGRGRPITTGSIINGNIPTNISVNRFGTVTPSSIANVVDDFGRPITSVESNENLPNVPANNIGTVIIGNNDLGLNRNPVGMNQNYGQKIIGEDFSGPKQPPRFDPETGYHY